MVSSRLDMVTMSTSALKLLISIGDEECVRAESKEIVEHGWPQILLHYNDCSPTSSSNFMHAFCLS